MKRAMLSTVAGILLLFVGAVTPAWSQAVFGPTQDPLAGSRVFGAKGCAKCHAVNGSGGGVGPDLGRVPRARSFYDLATAMWNHLPRMAERMAEQGIASPQLSTREAGDLIAFLYTLSYFDAPGDPQAGRRIFSDKRCIGCHQAHGTGGVVGPDLAFLGQFATPIFVAAAMWNHGPQMTQAMNVGGIARPTFTGNELRDLIAYLAPNSAGPTEGPLYTLPGRADTGRVLFKEKRCTDCHGARGEGGRVGPDLLDRGAHKTLIEFAAAMWNKAPAMTAAMKPQGMAMPQLRPEEMADIVAYLYSVRYFAEPGRRPNGWTVVTSKGCLRCHAMPGERGKTASDLSHTRTLESPAAAVAALWNHLVLMPRDGAAVKARWPQFGPGEMADLATFLQSVGGAR